MLSKTPMPFPYLDYIHAVTPNALGVVAPGALIVGYFGDRASVPERFFFFFLIWVFWRQENMSTVVGLILLLALYFYQRHRRIKRDGPYRKPKQSVPV